jgi:hypothetical protein
MLMMEATLVTFATLYAVETCKMVFLKKTKPRGRSPQAIYTDRATAASANL